MTYSVRSIYSRTTVANLYYGDGGYGYLVVGEGELVLYRYFLKLPFLPLKFAALKTRRADMTAQRAW